MDLPKDLKIFSKDVEMAAASKLLRDRMAAYAAPERRRDLDRSLVGIITGAGGEGGPSADSDIQSKLTEVLDRTRRQIDEIFNKPISPEDVVFVVDAEDKVTMFAVPHGRRMGIYFETDSGMRAFRDRLDVTGIAPLPRYAMPEPVSDRIELEHGLPLIVADPITWKMISTRNRRIIDLWLDPEAQTCGWVE